MTVSFKPKAPLAMSSKFNELVTEGSKRFSAQRKSYFLARRGMCSGQRIQKEQPPKGLSFCSAFGKYQQL